MYERERWQLILNQVRQKGAASVRELVALTGASAATIRRDLNKLHELGQLTRLHGGTEVKVSSEQQPLSTVAFGQSQTVNAAKKRALAAAAASLCQEGESIIINAGSTTWFMADHLRHLKLQILTNSLPIAQVLISNSNNRITLPGGEVYREQGIILSPFDEDSIQHFTASKMFMSCYSITSAGIVEGDPLIARAEAKLLSRAEKLIVVADSSKFVPRGSIVVCPFKRIHTLVTDDEAPDEMLALIQSMGVQVVTVSQNGVKVLNAA